MSNAYLYLHCCTHPDGRVEWFEGAGPYMRITWDDDTFYRLVTGSIVSGAEMLQLWQTLAGAGCTWRSYDLPGARQRIRNDTQMAAQTASAPEESNG